MHVYSKTIVSQDMILLKIIVSILILSIIFFPNLYYSYSIISSKQSNILPANA